MGERVAGRARRRFGSSPRALAVGALAGAATLVAAPALGAATPRRTVGVHDNFYAPAKLTVDRNTTIRWRWSEDAGDVHDVQLISAPKGVRKFQSDPLAAGLTLSRKLTRPGLYKFMCSFHEHDMTMQIRVRKAKKKRR